LFGLFCGLVREAGVFERYKVPVEDKVISAPWYCSDTSVKSVAQWRSFSYEAIRQ
jgi:hypothetical protein